MNQTVKTCGGSKTHGKGEPSICRIMSSVCNCKKQISRTASLTVKQILMGNTIVCACMHAGTSFLVLNFPNGKIK